VIPVGKWVQIDPKPTVDLEVDTSVVKDGKVTTTKSVRPFPVNKAIEFTADGYYVEERRANEAKLEGVPDRWRIVSNTESGLVLKADSGISRSVKLTQENGKLVLVEGGKTEAFVRG
jgi:hypothetical protein